MTQTPKHKEPPYLKLTARESMASINARRALNTYEEVTDRENMYATVSGNLRNTLRKVYLFIKITKELHLIRFDIFPLFYQFLNCIISKLYLKKHYKTENIIRNEFNLSYQ